MNPMPRNHPLHERFVEALWPLIDAAWAILNDGRARVLHAGDGCEQDVVLDVLPLLYLAQTVEQAFGLALYAWPVRCRRQALKARREGREPAARMYERMAQRLEAERAGRV